MTMNTTGEIETREESILERVVRSSPALLPSSVKAYCLAARLFVAHAGSSPSSWTPRAVAEWRDALLAAGQRGSSVNSMLRCLAACSERYSVYENRPELHFASRKLVERVRVGHGGPVREARVLDLAEIRRLLVTTDGGAPIDKRDRAILMVGLRLGLRVSSLASLQIEGVDLQEKRASFYAKGARFLSVPLDASVVAALKPYLAYLRENGISDGPLLRSFWRPRRGAQASLRGALTIAGLQDALCARAEAAGIEGFHPHCLRHTATSLLRRSGVPDWQIRELLGWSTDRMLDHYSHATWDGVAVPEFDKEK